MTNPNILFLMTDQQRWDAMSCAGDWVETPALDRIAAEGVRFTQCVTTTPICIPARVTLATGRYPHNNAVWNNLQYTMPPDAPTWMRAIRDLGYRTSLFGKTHLHPHQGDLREREHLLNAYGLDDIDEIGGPRASAQVMSHMTAGWEAKGLLEAYREDYAERFANKPHVVRPSVLPLEDYIDVYVGQQAKRYLENYNRDEPWCCWVSFGGPHEPWDAPEPFASMYDPEAMPAPVARPVDDRPRPRGWLDDRIEHGSPTFEPGDEAAMRANYAGNVTLIDDQIGQILAVIEERGELDNTVIGFTSDHGELNGDWGLIYKMVFLDGSVRVPMLVRTPETAKNGGVVSDVLVENCDLGPTLTELAGGKLTHRQFARSLCPALGGNGEHRDTVTSEIRGEFMLMTRDWKMALNDDGQCYLLFDRNDDPQETRNLAGLSESKPVEDELRLMALERLAQTQLKEP
ncbi:MAG: sulfatase-like hydrolase/transferase [Gammaproteobacteria bacterium]|nr:sulfatase-like hydrolase/transferase [Gammaproteobacteria bacterium]